MHSSSNWNATKHLFWWNSIFRVASLAQWQSTGLVNQGSRVQLPHEAIRMQRVWEWAVYSGILTHRLLAVAVLPFFKIFPFLAVKKLAKRNFPVPSLSFLALARYFVGPNSSYAWLRKILKIHHQASFVRRFLKLSLFSCYFHAGILFILTALGIDSW